MSDWEDEALISARTVPADIFQEARDNISQDIAGIIELLKNKQVEMLAIVDKLEKDFKDKQQQTLSCLNKLNSMKSRTEEELGENILKEIQNKIISELQMGIDKLSIDIERCCVPNFSIKVNWGKLMSCFHSMIGDSKIEVVDLTPWTPQDNRPSYSQRRRYRGKKWKQGSTKSRFDHHDTWDGIDWENPSWASVEPEGWD